MTKPTLPKHLGVVVICGRSVVSYAYSIILHLLVLKSGAIHTVPEEFENSGFILKTHHTFSGIKNNHG